MRRYFHATISLLILVLFLYGCSTKFKYFLTSFGNSVDVSSININGSQGLKYYTFSIDGDSHDTFLFFIGGSGCSSFRYYLREYLKGLKGHIKVFALQKRGFNHFATGLFGCSEKFYKNDYFNRWVSDQELFINYILKNAKETPENIVILGVSEGCSTAAVLATKMESVTHLAMIGCGGMRFIDELRILFKRGQIPFDIDKEYEKIFSNPDDTSIFLAGHTYKYWSSILDMDPLEYLLSLDIPIIVAMGDKDKSVPVDSIIFLKRQFKKAGKQNLTAIIYHGADHTLRSSEKDFRHDFMKQFGEWIYKNEPNKALHLTAIPLALHSGR
ncbi:MAG TPA: hypothetical protein ENJ28_09525 [Gammaproteobacteria bacterium]|nr:hypothetical protein [Gammaproteobacteria bacterium]